MEEVSHIKDCLRRNGDSQRAEQMQAYLRNQFSFFGVMSVPRKAILKEYKTQRLKTLSPSEKRSLVRLLWDEPQRECQLIALEWMMQWNPKEYCEEDIDFFESLILQKSWWDTVDGIAPNLIGKYAKRFPEKMKSVLSTWEHHPSFWIRRTCLIFQLRYRQDTDLALLKHFIHSFKSDKEFFIQKAIGWSLREVAKHNPIWVKETVQKESLIGLARREALKHLA
ncbi:MAG: DNA alkylation repair protein [Flavobacteriales bacterium]